VRLSARERRVKGINTTKFHRKSGGAKPRDLQFNEPLLEVFFDQNRIVIPTGAQRSGGTCCSPSHIAKLNESAALPFVIPGKPRDLWLSSASPQTYRGSQ
jgi:hypothetical protein